MANLNCQKLNKVSENFYFIALQQIINIHLSLLIISPAVISKKSVFIMRDNSGIVTNDVSTLFVISKLLEILKFLVNFTAQNNVFLTLKENVNLMIFTRTVMLSIS